MTAPARKRPLGVWWVAAWCAALPLTVLAEDVPSNAPSPKAVEALRLLESEDAYQRALGFLRLEALREPATVPAIRRYLDHKSPELRAYSIRALAAIQGLQAVPLLLEHLRSDREPVVRRAALLALEPFQTHHPDIFPAALAALRDRNTQVRMAAVDIVSRIDNPQAKDAIRKRYRREGRRDVRRVLDLAMKRIGPS